MDINSHMQPIGVRIMATIPIGVISIWEVNVIIILNVINLTTSNIQTTNIWFVIINLTVGGRRDKGIEIF